MNYILEYVANQASEKVFFFGALSMIYLNDARDIVESAYKDRNAHY